MTEVSRRAIPAIGLLGAALFLGTAWAQGQTRSEPYANVGEWNVEFVPGSGARNPAHCRITKIFGTENALRIVSGAKFFAIDYMGAASHALGQSYDVSYWLDNLDPNHPPSSAVAQLVPDNEGTEWMRIEESTDEPGSSDALMNARLLTIKAKVGNNQWRYALAGSGAALKSLFDCREAKIPNQQVAPAPLAQARPAPNVTAAAQIAPPPAIPPSQNQGRPADCLMTINGRNFIDGRCQFEADADGSFRVFGEKYFAYVTVMSPGVAEASWNHDPPTGSAQAPLGELRRRGACWESSTVRICAWGLGQRPPQTPVVQTAPPPVQVAPPRPSTVQAAPRSGGGQSFFLRAEGGLCVDVQGGKLEPFTAIQLWPCHGRSPQLFFYDAGAQEIRVAARQDLCIEVEHSPEPVQRLHLVACNGQQQSKQRWTYNSQTGAVRSAEGECWDVPRANYRQGQALVGNRCRPNQPSQQFELNNAIAAAPPPPPAQAGPPAGNGNGLSFYAKAEGADVPSLCADVAGGHIRPGTQLWLWQCNSRPPQRFVSNPSAGLIVMAADSQLCVDARDREPLRLVPCRQVLTQWRYDRGTDTVRSDNGLCWDIQSGHIPNNVRQRAPLIAWRCNSGLNQQFVLNN